MKTLFILMNCCHCGRPANPANWQPVVDAIPCICWEIIMLIALYLILKLIVFPLIKNCHEMKMKDNSFKNEKYWAFYKKIEEPTEEKLSKLQNEVDELKKKEENLDKGKENLKKEKEEFEKQILEEKIKVYQEIIKQTK